MFVIVLLVASAYAEAVPQTAMVVNGTHLPTCGGPTAPAVWDCSKDENGKAHQICNECQQPCEDSTSSWKISCASKAGFYGCTLEVNDPDNACAVDRNGQCCYSQAPATPPPSPPTSPTCGTQQAVVVHDCSRDENGQAHQVCGSCSAPCGNWIPCVSTAGNPGCTLSPTDLDNACALDDHGSCCYVPPPATPSFDNWTSVVV